MYAYNIYKYEIHYVIFLRLVHQLTEILCLCELPNIFCRQILILLKTTRCPLGCFTSGFYIWKYQNYLLLKLFIYTLLESPNCLSVYVQIKCMAVDIHVCKDDFSVFMLSPQVKERVCSLKIILYFKRIVFNITIYFLRGYFSRSSGVLKYCMMSSVQIGSIIKIRQLKRS